MSRRPDYLSAVIQAVFAPAARAAALALLEGLSSTDLPHLDRADPRDLERIRFAVTKVSDGNIGALRDAVELAGVDWRDVLVAAGFADDVRAHAIWARSFLHRA